MQEFNFTKTTSERWKGVIILQMGGKNTGKSTCTAEYMKKFAAKGKALLIYDLIGHDYFKHLPILTLEQLPYWDNKGIFRVIDDDVFQFMELIFKYVRNTAVIFDDATKYFQGVLPTIYGKCMLQSRNHCNDYFINAHFLALISPEALGTADFIILRDTYEKPSLIKSLKKGNSHLIAKYLMDVQQENAIRYPHKRGQKVPQLAHRIIDPGLPYSGKNEL